MKLKTLKLAVLALAGLASLATSANAATITTQNGDLILAVYQTSGSAQGFGNTYEVDLGSLTGFAASVTNLNLSSRVSIADLNTIFGADLSSTSWDVVGTSGSSDFTLGSTTVFTSAVLITSQSTPLVASDSSHNALSPASGKIGAEVSGLNGQTTFSGNSSTAAELATASPANKGINEWALPTTGQNLATENSFGSVGNFYLIDPHGDIPPPSNGTANGSVTSLGTFQFVGGTTFEYNFSAVPEPSTYALMGLGALLLVWTVRRRSSSNV